MGTPKVRNVITKSVGLNENTYDRLRRTGYTGDTFDSLVTRLLDCYDSQNKDVDDGE